MKIALIGQNFDENSGQGVYKYSGQLYKNLKKSNNDFEKIELGTSKNPYKTIFINILKSIYLIFRTKSDIYHFMMPEISFPCLFKKNCIVTVHDIIPLILKNERKKSFNLYFKFMMWFVKKADHIIVISKSTKRDLINLLNISDEKITVIYLGINHKQFYPLYRKKNKKIVIGYIGGLGKRKNIKFILKLAKEFKNNKKILFKIAGKGPELNNLLKIKNKLKLNNVEFVGFVPEEKLNEFYNSLDLFIFPSLYEGFGLPILEAMVCGVPVLFSNVSSLPELVSDAGIIIDINNVLKTKEDIEKIIKNKKLQNKMGLREIKQAKKFSWEKTAKETLKVYGSLK